MRTTDPIESTFAAGLRSVLRHDPDVIMVGEIRDHETAVMAIPSALTGHLVFSTLHTIDAASAVTRLSDLGIEPYLVSSSLLAVMAKRLVRKVCPDCAEQRPATQQELAFLQTAGDCPDFSEPARKNGTVPLSSGGLLTHGRGCENCRETGYRGRGGVFELLMVNDPVRAKTQDRSNASEIRDVALKM